MPLGFSFTSLKLLYESIFFAQSSVTTNFPKTSVLLTTISMASSGDPFVEYFTDSYPSVLNFLLLLQKSGSFGNVQVPFGQTVFHVDVSPFEFFTCSDKPM